MKDNYFELRVTSSSFLGEIESFLLDHFNNGIEEESQTLILRSEEPFEGLIKALKVYIYSLEQIFDTKIDIETSVEKKENSDWIENYRQSIQPVEIDSFYIHPSWHEPKENRENILIDPALAFGSGHHETTRTCVEALQKYVKNGSTLLDVGTGSGILAIVASKIGVDVSMCDTDPLAVSSAKENFEKNGATFQEAWVGSATLSQKTYDIVVANIIADVLIMIHNDLKKRTDNLLILSGIIDKYKQRVLDKFTAFTLVETIEENEWVTLILKKDSNAQ